MTVIFVTSQDFLKEVTQWGIKKDTLAKVRMMKKGNFIHCRFAIPHTSEEIETVVEEVTFDEFEWMNLRPIATPAIWNNEMSELKKINTKLEELNAYTQNIPSYRNQDIQHK